jgi:histidine triad (HIT) family protein
MDYDSENIFAKILRGEIPNKTIFEDQYVLAFEDINPQAPVHVLIIPKGPYSDIADFGAHASMEEQAAFANAIGRVVKIKKIDKTGFRSIANTGTDGMQEVPHYHMHVLGGCSLGPMVISV